MCHAAHFCSSVAGSQLDQRASNHGDKSMRDGTAADNNNYDRHRTRGRNRKNCHHKYHENLSSHKATIGALSIAVSSVCKDQ